MITSKFSNSSECQNFPVGTSSIITVFGVRKRVLASFGSVLLDEFRCGGKNFKSSEIAVNEMKWRIAHFHNFISKVSVMIFAEKNLLRH